jgi:hypothetical protein
MAERPDIRTTLLEIIAEMDAYIRKDRVWVVGRGRTCVTVKNCRKIVPGRVDFLALNLHF